MISEAVQPVHPRGLLRQWNLAEADQSDTEPARDQAGDELARVCPVAIQRVGRDENMHGQRRPGLILFWMRDFAKLFLTGPSGIGKEDLAERGGETVLGAGPVAKRCSISVNLCTVSLYPRTPQAAVSDTISACFD